ncbi:MAG: hypothetical protein LBC09_05105 [Helicobacteraceae bacterium]|jgi:hypothetical protein|nr:hypothetical protein [Helicobacteraceae bacterium]
MFGAGSYVKSLLAAICFCAIATPLLAKESRYTNKYAEALQADITIYSHLYCGDLNSQFIFYVYDRGDYIHFNSAEQAIANLVKSGVAKDMIFFVDLRKTSGARSISYLSEAISQLHIDTASRFYFTFPDYPITLHFELIESDKKNAERQDGGKRDNTRDIAYFWINDMKDKRIKCSLSAD